MREYFSRLLGNRETARRLGRAIEDGVLSHAFLIGGPSGSGKSTLAIELARAVNCERKSSDAALPCGECSACKRILEGNFPDVKILAKPSDRATLGVDPIKDLREDMFLSSTEASIKVYIIDDAECMTVEAQNALLKVLEEPPRDVIIILLARECDKILSTIKSRTQYIAMSRFDENELRSILPRICADAESLKRESAERFDSVVMSADGRLGEAIRLCDRRISEECDAERAQVIRLLTALRGATARAELYAAVSAMQTNNRTELIFSIERVISALRDLITVHSDSDVRLLFFTSRADAVSLSKDIGIRRTLAAYDALCEAHELCTKNANINGTLTNLLARLCRKD